MLISAIDYVDIHSQDLSRQTEDFLASARGELKFVETLLGHQHLPEQVLAYRHAPDPMLKAASVSECKRPAQEGVTCAGRFLGRPGRCDALKRRSVGTHFPNSIRLAESTGFATSTGFRSTSPHRLRPDPASTRQAR